MANAEHVKKIRQGWRRWQDWRAKNPAIIPDLSEAKLASLDLVDFDLRRVNFRKADLRDATIAITNLDDADLTEANLAGADMGLSSLARAKLNKAHLGYTQFIDSYLEDANLRGAHCISTNFRGANLTGVNLELATFNYTILGDVNLTNAKGLELVKHFTYSVLDHRTITQSGKLPLVFLRGCGLPDSLIEYYRMLNNSADHFYSCFISFSSKDQRFVEKLYNDLQNRGVRCWFAPEDLIIGDKVRPRIDESIRSQDKLLLVLSKDSIASQWVEQEVETALAKEREQERVVLFPIRLDDTVMKISSGWPALIKNSRNIGNFEKWQNRVAYQKALERLVRDLKVG